MRILIGLAVWTLAFAAPVFAQQSGVTWQRVISVVGNRGEINKLAIAANGDIVVAGFVSRGGVDHQGSSEDAWLARYAPDGRQLWARQFGGEYRDTVSSMKVDRDGSILVAAWANIQYTQSKDLSDGLIARYSSSGELLWQTLLHDDARNITPGQLLLPGDGSIFVFGHDAVPTKGGTRALVIKLDRDGKKLWQFNPPEFVPGISPDAGGVRFTDRNGRQYAFEEAVSDRIDGDTLRVDVFQNAMTKNGLTRCFAVSMTSGAGAAASCGPVVLAGLFPIASAPVFSTRTLALYANNRAVARKQDANGDVLWERTYHNDQGEGFDMLAATPDGGAIGAGYIIDGPTVEMHNWHALLMKIDKDGNEVWRRTFGGSRRDEFKGVGVLPDGSIIVAGYTGSQGGASDWNPWLMRLDAQGELEGEALKELQQRQK